MYIYILYIYIYVFVWCAVLVISKSITKQNKVRQHIIKADLFHKVSGLGPSSGENN